MALVGPPNGGKSSLLARLTRAAPLVADYPFSTRRPLPGMMAFENIQIQLIDLPPLHPDSPDALWVPQTVRIADAAVLVVGLDEPAVLEQLTEVLALLERGKVRLGRDDGAELPRGFVRKPALLLGNKLEAAGARDAFETLAELWGERCPLLALSLESGQGLDAFRRAVYELLGIVRVYSKAPGKKADLGSPFVVPRGATVREVAERVHKDFAAGLKFARLWGGAKYDGQRVHND
ncbi:MAG: GTPase, partial [Terriglobia bacterium]